jgi:hypothetical protein
MLYSFFWVNPQRLNFMFRDFATLSFSFLPIGVNYSFVQTFRNVGILISDFGDSPKRKNKLSYIINARIFHMLPLKLLLPKFVYMAFPSVDLSTKYHRNSFYNFKHVTYGQIQVISQHTQVRCVA